MTGELERLWEDVEVAVEDAWKDRGKSRKPSVRAADETYEKSIQNIKFITFRSANFVRDIFAQINM
jgi:hypothetical protein